MFGFLKSVVLSICRVPPEPAPPVGAPDSLETFRAAPQYYRYRVVVWALSQLAFLLTIAAAWFAAWSAAQDAEAPRFVVGVTHVLAGALTAGWLILALVGYAMQRLDYELRWYMMTDRSLRIREGVVVVHEMTLTFANVQNVVIAQGPLQRWLGIADVEVQTAGGGGATAQAGSTAAHVGVLRGVEQSERLRERILQRMRAAHDSGLGDARNTAGGAAESVADACATLRAEATALRLATARLR